MFVLGQIIKLIQLLNSEKGAWSIASGFALGMVFGLVPSNILITVALFFFFCLFRIHGGAMFLSWALFALFAYLLDPLFDRFGYWLLTGVPSLTPFWIRGYNLPVVPWTNFNNSVTMGSLTVGLAAFFPMLLLFKLLIDRYRQSVLIRLSNSRVFKYLRTTKVYSLYKKYERVKETMS